MHTPPPKPLENEPLTRSKGDERLDKDLFILWGKEPQRHINTNLFSHHSREKDGTRIYFE